MTATATIAFVKDDRTERWLNDHKVNFSGPTPIKLSEVDRKASRHNQARPLAINPEGVERYRQAIRNGQDLPAIVVYKSGGKWVIVDGNNREQAAADEKIQKVRAYILDPNTPSEAITMLTVAANVNNGMAVDKSWMLHNALYLVELGYTKPNVSRLLNISVSAIDAHEKERVAGARAHSLRVTGWETMTIRMRQVIGKIHMDKPFVIVAEAAISTKVGYTPDFGMMITKINKAAGEEEAVAIATEWANAVTEDAKQRARQGKKGKAVNSPKLSLLTALGKLKAFPMGVFNATFATDQDRKIITERVDNSVETLVEMSYRLRGKEETEEFILGLLDRIGNQE